MSIPITLIQGINIIGMHVIKRFMTNDINSNNNLLNVSIDPVYKAENKHVYTTASIQMVNPETKDTAYELSIGCIFAIPEVEKYITQKDDIEVLDLGETLSRIILTEATAMLRGAMLVDSANFRFGVILMPMISFDDIQPIAISI